MLEAGCGRTTRLAAYRDRIDELTGVDLDADGGRENRTLDRFVVADLCERLPFDDGAFDLVYANFVIEHLPSPLGRVRRMAPGAQAGREPDRRNEQPRQPAAGDRKPAPDARQTRTEASRCRRGRTGRLPDVLSREHASSSRLAARRGRLRRRLGRLRRNPPSLRQEAASARSRAPRFGTRRAGGAALDDRRVVSGGGGTGPPVARRPGSESCARYPAASARRAGRLPS